jgi:hypothetical protein
MERSYKWGRWIERLGRKTIHPVMVVLVAAKVRQMSELHYCAENENQNIIYTLTPPCLLLLYILIFTGLTAVSQQSRLVRMGT